MEKLSQREADLSARDQDLRDVIARHETTIQQLASKGEINIHDEVIKMMQQKVDDVTAVLDSKLKVIQMLQGDVTARDKSLAERATNAKLLEEKLSVTSEQVKILQTTLMTSETQWSKEREAYENMMRDSSAKPASSGAAAADPSSAPSAAYVEQLTQSVKQYEGAYQQLSTQYAALHAEYSRVTAVQERIVTQPLTAAAAPPAADSTGDDDVQQLRAQLQEQTTAVKRLESELEQAKQGCATGGATVVEKADTKFLKYKAQTTAKIKNLEKQIEQLKKVHV